jgi:quercetin dioxygenase-like cupin family protein
MSDTVLGRFSLAEEAGRFVPEAGASGRRAETLIKTDDLRVVLITMRAGAELQEHTAPGTITIQALAGAFTVETAGATVDLRAGDLVSLAGGVQHAVRAELDGAFLLTIAWRGGALPA